LTHQHHAGAFERVALLALIEHQRDAGIGKDVPGVQRQPRQQQQRRAIHRRGNVDERTIGIARSRHQRRQGTVAPFAQQLPGRPGRVEGVVRHHIASINPLARQNDSVPGRLVIAVESHSCCKEATFQTLFVGFKTRGTSARQAQEGLMPTIALVDDDRNILTSVSMALESEGYRIMTYTDGASALDGFRTSPPDLAILDIKMPRMDGMETLRRLRQKTDIPVIFLTSKDEEIDELFGLKM